MKITLGGAMAALVLVSTALCQVPIPPHLSIYNGYSRGINFTAATNFYIVQLGLPMDAFQAGDRGAYLVRVNSVNVLYSVGNTASSICTNIPVVTGDVVDVIGHWSPVVTGNFTAHNSYGSGAFATTIEGVPHTLNRTGWQWDIADPAYTSGTYLAPTTGSLGRVLIYTSASAPTMPCAAATPYGTGCGGLTLTATPPVVSTTINFTTGGITPTASFGAIVLGLVRINPPIDLTAIGMAGCFQYHDNLVTMLFVPLGAASMVTPFQIPNNFPGVTFQAQAVSYDPAAHLTQLGAVTSSAFSLTTGR